MDFRGREESFQEADRRYNELMRQRDAGSISDQEFDAQRRQLMVQDAEGRWWAKIGKSGEWHYRDGSAWVRGTPPGYQVTEPISTEPISSPAQTTLLQHPKDVENRENWRRRVPPWMLVAGLGIALVGIVVVWVLVPYLRGEPAPSKQGEAMSVKQSEPTPGGAAFDAAFIHRATPENISENSTYLDNPLTNDNPDVILYVTQNWNPEGSSTGTYNDHSIGVWYNTDRQKWAIFNQDREPMPDGAAFNVVVLRSERG